MDQIVNQRTEIRTPEQPYFSLSGALWNQRHAIAELRPRLLAFSRAVADPISLSLPQYAQFTATALEFQPDLIVELGRAMGNTTCLFTEVANRLGKTRVLSLDVSSMWRIQTVDRLRELEPQSWFTALDAREADILSFDFRQAIEGAGRVLLLWDAHGYAVARTVLGKIMPELARREHLVLMHDICDTRHTGMEHMDYGDEDLWTGGNDSNCLLKIGFLQSRVEQFVAILDFSTRNGFPLHSADHILHTEIDTIQAAELSSLWGDFFSLFGQWIYFSLKEGRQPPTFPRLTAIDRPPESPPKLAVASDPTP